MNQEIYLRKPTAAQAPLPARAAMQCEDEAGFLLLGVVVLVALVLIALSVAAPVIAKDIRHDKEIESEHRAQQYVRGIRLYYRKLNSYPPSMEALKKSNNIRFLRKEYADPLTGKADWRIIHLGEQKTTIKVFFGQELAGIGGAGAGGSGLGSAAGLSSGFNSANGSTGAASTIGATSPLAGGFSGASVGTNGSNGGTGTSSTSSTGGLGSLGGFGSTGATGSTGGGAIIGVGPARTGTSIASPNKQTTYETWEFWYDPRIELLYKKGQLNAGMSSGSLKSQPASSFGATGANGTGGSSGGFGSSSSFGSSSTFGGNGQGGNGFGGSGLGGTGSGSNAPGSTGPSSPNTPGTSSAPQ